MPDFRLSDTTIAVTPPMKAKARVWSRSFGTGGRDASEQVGAIAGMRSCAHRMIATSREERASARPEMPRHAVTQAAALGNPAAGTRQ